MPLVIIFDLVGVIVSCTATYTTIESVKGFKVDPVSALSSAFNKTLNIIVVSILASLIGAISFVALIVPAFFVLPRLYLILYFVLDQNMGPIEAIKASWNYTKGSVGKIYGILGVNILISACNYSRWYYYSNLVS